MSKKWQSKEEQLILIGRKAKESKIVKQNQLKKQLKKINNQNNKEWIIQDKKFHNKKKRVHWFVMRHVSY